MSMLFLIVGAMALLSLVMFFIEKQYRKNRFEEKRTAYLREHAVEIISHRKQRFATANAIRREVKTSEAWQEFCNRKQTGRPISHKLREAIGFELEITEATHNRVTRKMLIEQFQAGEKIVEQRDEPSFI